MTCLSCHNSHTKCIYSTIHQVRCDRCIKRDTDCFDFKSRQGARSDLLHATYDEALMKDNAPHTRGSPSLVNDSFNKDDINDDDDTEDEDDDTESNDGSTISHLESGFVFGDFDSPEDSSVSGFGYYEEDDNNDCRVILKVMLKLPGTCKGKRGVFEIGGTNILKRYEIDGRYSIPDKGPVSFIQSTSHSHFTHNCENHSIVYRETVSDDWRYAIVESIFYLQDNNSNGVIYLSEWTGILEYPGLPKLFKCKTYDEMKTHLTRRCYDLDDIELVFVNQIRGDTILNIPIDTRTRNSVDGGVQCLPTGSDIIDQSIILPNPRRSHMNYSWEKELLSSSHIGLPDLLVSNQDSNARRRHGKRKRKILVIPDEIKKTYPFLLRWLKGPKKIPRHEHKCRIIVSRSLQGEFISSSDTTAIPKADKGKFYLPILSTFEDTKTPLVQFKRVTPKSLSSFQKRHPKGIPIKDIGTIFSKQISTSLLCTEKLKSEDNFHGYTKVFAGKSAPPIDDSFDVIDVPDCDRKVYSKIVPARSLHNYVALSIGSEYASVV